MQARGDEEKRGREISCCCCTKRFLRALNFVVKISLYGDDRHLAHSGRAMVPPGRSKGDGTGRDGGYSGWHTPRRYLSQSLLSFINALAHSHLPKTFGCRYATHEYIIFTIILLSQHFIIWYLFMKPPPVVQYIFTHLHHSFSTFIWFYPYKGSNLVASINHNFRLNVPSFGIHFLHLKETTLVVK